MSFREQFSHNDMLSFYKELCDNYNREVNTMKQTLWTREFTRITAATALGAAGGIISQFALSFLVFDETGSTLAAALGGRHPADPDGAAAAGRRSHDGSSAA